MQVTRLQENVSQAVLPASGLEAVQYLGVSLLLRHHHSMAPHSQLEHSHRLATFVLLQKAEQNISRLQQLASQLQKLAAAVQSATPPAAQSGRGQQAWAAGLQDQAKQATTALQQQVAAALSGPHPGLMGPVQQPSQHAHIQPLDDTGVVQQYCFACCEPFR